jgi:hypothetical protein
MNQQPQSQTLRRKWPKWCSVCKNDKHNTTTCKHASSAQRQEGINEQANRRTTLAKRNDERAAWTMKMIQASNDEQTAAQYRDLVEWKDLYDKIEAGQYKIT